MTGTHFTLLAGNPEAWDTETKDRLANGGTPATWKGRPATLDNDTKARAAVRACRGREAQKESGDA